MNNEQPQKIDYDTTSAMPMHHDRRLLQISQMPVYNCDYLFLGNSITEQGFWEKRLDTLSVVNHGISGDLTFSVLHRLQYTIKQNPKVIFLMIGINDLGKRVPDSIITKNIFKIIKKLNQDLPKTKIHLQSILPINNEILGFPDDFNYFKNITKINQKLIDNKKELNYTYIDLHSEFKDSEGNLKEKFTFDGLHLNEEGYKNWILILKSKKSI